MATVQRFFARALVLVAGLTALGCVATASAQLLPKRVVGDYGYWSRTQSPPYSAAQIPFAKLTHINHAGVSFDATGALSVPKGFLEPELIEKAHAAGVKVMLLLGGDFVGLEKNSKGLQALVANVQAFVNEKGYDGVDIDWEYPSSSLDKKTFFALMSALRQAMPDPTYVLSADVPPWGPYQYDFPHVEPLVDYFNVMMYDCAGPWTGHAQLNSAIFPDPNNPAPYECEPGGSVKEAANIYLENLRIPPSKINMGTPFYAYHYRTLTALWGECPNSDCSNSVDSVNYGTFVKPRIDHQGWVTYYDPISLAPYMLRADGKPGYITYDDYFSTYYKVWYSDWFRGLGGTFLWELSADYDGHSQDLLDAMYHASIQQNN